MKALTVRQPWAGAIFAQADSKDVENRKTAWTYRGPLAIHAGQQLADRIAFTDVTLRLGRPPQIGSPKAPTEWALGAVIGLVDLVDIHPSRSCRCSCSPWAMPYHQHLRLENPRVLRRPVPAYGRQGLWNPGDELRAEIERTLP